MIAEIRKRAKDFVAIIILVLLALGISYFILTQQRLRFPWQESQKEIKAEFQTAQAVTPGQGQTVRISGVKVGDISKVDLKNGVAVITMAIDPQYKDRIHTNASALLRPKTGLKDMFVEVNPGNGQAPVAKKGWTIPLKSTLPDVNPDEILSALDTDTRGYLQLLVKGAGQGLDKRGGSLAEVFRRLEPTHRDLARFSKAVAVRRQNVRDLTTALADLNEALAKRRRDLTQLVDASASVLSAFASEEGNISTAVRLLPGTLKATTTTLRKVQRFANILPPATRAIIPAIREIPGANRSLSSLANAETGDVRTKIRPFVRSARPVVRDLRPSVVRLAKATPKLDTSFLVLNHLFNTLAHNPRGAESASNPNRQEGYLFWLAWLNHQALTLFSAQDANGGFRPLFLTLGCSSAKQLAAANPLAETALNLTPILSNPQLCGNSTGGPLGGGLNLPGGGTGALPGGLPVLRNGGLSTGVKSVAGLVAPSLIAPTTKTAGPKATAGKSAAPKTATPKTGTPQAAAPTGATPDTSGITGGGR